MTVSASRNMSANPSVARTNFWDSARSPPDQTLENTDVTEMENEPSAVSLRKELGIMNATW